jgi:hypothetical protein
MFDRRALLAGIAAVAVVPGFLPRMSYAAPLEDKNLIVRVSIRALGESVVEQVMPFWDFTTRSWCPEWREWDRDNSREVLDMVACQTAFSVIDELRG